MEGLFKSLALQNMPANMQNIDRKKSGKFVGSSWIVSAQWIYSQLSKTDTFRTGSNCPS